MPACQHQVGTSKQGEQLRSVLRQATVACLPMAEQVLHNMERMLNFRAHAGLEVFEFFAHASQLVLRQRFAFGALHRHVPGHRFMQILCALFHALIAGVTERGDFIAVRQRVRLRYVQDVAGGANQCVHKSRRSIDTDVG